MATIWARLVDAREMIVMSKVNAPAGQPTCMRGSAHQYCTCALPAHWDLTDKQEQDVARSQHTGVFLSKTADKLGAYEEPNLVRTR